MAGTPQTKRFHTEVDPNSPSPKPEGDRVPLHLREYIKEAIENALAPMHEQLTDLKNVTKDVSPNNADDIAQYKQEIDSLKSQLNMVCEQLSAERKMNKQLGDKILSLESYSRKDNLRFLNIREEKGEVCKDKVLHILHAHGYGIPPNGILKAHRVGPFKKVNEKYPRPIIVRFLFSQDRDIIFYSKQQFAKVTSVEEDFPREIEEQRRYLLPVAQHAGSMKNEHGNRKYVAKVNGNKLIVNGKPYTSTTLDSLPEDLVPAKVFTPSKQKMTAFFTKFSPLSNHFKCQFKCGSKTYNCSEQFYMEQKALSVGDEDTAHQIMETTDPVKQKHLGEMVRGLSKETWQRQQEAVMKMGLRQKFSQNEKLKEFLLQTGENQLFECNPTDKYWGIGLSLKNQRIWNTGYWKGQNTLGKLLMEVRDELK